VTDTLEVAPAPETHEVETSRTTATLRTTARWLVAFISALVVFSALLLVKGVNPLTAYADAWSSTFADPVSLQQVLIKATPMIFAALAVVVPGRAGLVNVGGEGQLIVGAVAAAGTALLVDTSLPGGATLALMALAAAVAGGAWAGLAAVLRVTVRVNEAVTTLLLNYVALDLLLFLIYQPWKDKDGSGQPATRQLAADARLPVLSGTTVHVGIIVALVAAVAVWLVLRFTSWGFRLRVVGGNPQAAHRAGLPVTALILSAMIVGGALAGLGGMAHFAGVEYKLRPGVLTSFGYIGFLASWLVRHRPVPVVLASLLLAAVAVAGDSLQIDSGLPAASVNVLMGLLLFAVLGWVSRDAKS
jgi:general nucleoside transport system permease protein